MKFFTTLLFFCVLLGISSCRNDFETVSSTGNLVFSKDTVYLDTVFNSISSSTYKLKVYNNSNNDINIPVIQLGKGLNSNYRMIVDGMTGNQGKIFNNITLLAKDSLYVFIEITPKNNKEEDFLYTDEILFDTGKNAQKVNLVTLVKDAIFLYPKRLSDGSTEIIDIENQKFNGFYLNPSDPINGNELHFTNKKAYVIYGYAAVPEGQTIIFDPGARVYFHNNSGLIVTSKSTMLVNGDISKTPNLENEVIFSSDRLEPKLDNVPKQWDAVWFAKESLNNSLNHLTLKNANVGLYIESEKNQFLIKNTQVYNCAQYGILAINSNINGENIVVNNCGKSSLACVYGGNYIFSNCTFNNNWSASLAPTVIISNNLLGVVPEAKNLTAATFNNCIIYGVNSNSFILNKNASVDFEYLFNNCLIKFNSQKNNPLYQFYTDTSHYKNIILNENPNFKNPNINQFNIDQTSSAFGKGNAEYLVPIDILGKERTSPVDLGAYKSDLLKN